MTDALAGVRVVDMATVVAGPGTAKYLADFGADVIKVEAPSGDPARRMGWTASGEVDSLFWKILSRGKRCVTLDLKDADDLARMRPLLDSADVLIENMRPGKLEALGLAPTLLLRPIRRWSSCVSPGSARTAPMPCAPDSPPSPRR